MKGTKAGVLFQNADGNINMGVWFDDPEIEIGDIFWYNILAQEISSMRHTNNRGLISIDQEYKTKSCYVELHRIGGLKITGLFLESVQILSIPVKAIRLDKMVKIISLQSHR